MNDAEIKAVDHWDLINRLAGRRFGKTPLAEEAALFAMNGLVENDGRRLQGYSGKAPFKAFLASVTWALLEDFSRKRYGRKRPPKWIQNLGGIWLRLYILLCFERLSVDEAVQTVGQERKDRHMELMEDAAWKIKEQVVDCGSHQGLEVSLDDEGQEVLQGTGVSHAREEEERIELFRLLFSALTDAESHVLEKNLNKLSSLRPLLTPEEKLLLKLCYQDDLNVTRAGEMLGLTRHQAHGRLRRLLARIKNEFEQIGLDRELMELLHQ